MRWSKIFKPFLVTKIFLYFILGNPYSAFSSAGINIEALKQDKETLRHIALVVFNREKDITYIKDKICTHSPQLFDIWKENKWQSIDTIKRTTLSSTLEEKYKIVPSQTRRLLQRDEFSLLDQKIIDEYVVFGNRAIKEAQDHDITLIQNPDNKKWSIKILMDFNEIEVGKLYERKNLEYPISTHTLNIDIDVDDIIKKITASGLKAWDFLSDGFTSTMCATNR